MAKSYICVFDCETIPDTDLIRKVFGFDGDDYSVSLQAFARQKELSGSEFLPIMFHKVVAISAVMADEYGKFTRVSTLQGENEREILSKFIKFINDFHPRLVSFNGRGFDLPMIMTRAMKYNLNAFAYYEITGNNKDKWKNYRTRYDPTFHLDLLDDISDFGAVRGLKLDHLCSSLNLPGKYDISGDQVLELFYENEIEKINEYCESDTLNTYWLFLKFELLHGNITEQDYAFNLQIMSEFLLKNCKHRSYTPIFCEHIELEIARLNGKLSYENSYKKSDEEYESDENFEKISIDELDSHLEKQGLGDILKKGVNFSTKKREKDSLKDDLPEINLDDE